MRLSLAEYGHATRPLCGLAPGGVCPASPVTSPAVRSYRTFSPFPLKKGSLFSVALSLGSPPAAVSRHPDLLEPGLSSPLAQGDHPAV